MLDQLWPIQLTLLEDGRPVPTLSESMLVPLPDFLQEPSLKLPADTIGQLVSNGVMSMPIGAAMLVPLGVTSVHNGQNAAVATPEAIARTTAVGTIGRFASNG